MSALTLQVASDLIAAHIGFVTGSIAREPAMPFKPLATLPDDTQFNARSRPAESPSPQERAASGNQHTNAASAAGDPFARYANTPIALHRDGQEYERDSMQDGSP